MPLYLYDDAQARTFEPFAATRPVSELCAGAMLTRQRWVHLAGMPAAGSLAAPHLRDFAEPGAPPVVDRVPAGSWIANSRCVPAAAAWPAADILLCLGRVAAVRAARPAEARECEAGRLALDALAPPGGTRAEIGGRWIEAVWDYVGGLPEQLAADIPVVAAALTLDDAAQGAVTRIGGHPLYLERGATVEPHVVFDLRAGPVLVRRGATVQAFTRVVGPCAVGEGSTVVADRIAASSIGERCKVHGELSVSIVLGYTNKSHDGFVGHSYLGRWVNIGAGTITSNLKNTYGAVQLWTPGGVRDTGLTFLGSLIGDYARTGIGMRLTTGTVIGAGANVIGASAPKYVPPFAWGDAGGDGTGDGYDTFALDKFIEVAARQMARREVALDEGGRRHLTSTHAHALTARGSPAR